MKFQMFLFCKPVKGDFRSEKSVVAEIDRGPHFFRE
jgi:hypothetical protein